LEKQRLSRGLFVCVAKWEMGGLGKMSEQEQEKQYKFNELPDELENWLVPSKFVGMMSGAKYAKQSKSGLITLIYEDDTTEEAMSEKDLLTEFDSFFSIVSYVQSFRAT
jgi:hypothetical protein